MSVLWAHGTNKRFYLFLKIAEVKNFEIENYSMDASESDAQILNDENEGSYFLLFMMLKICFNNKLTKSEWSLGGKLNKIHYTYTPAFDQIEQDPICGRQFKFEYIVFSSSLISGDRLFFLVYKFLAERIFTFYVLYNSINIRTSIKNVDLKFFLFVSYS